MLDEAAKTKINLQLEEYRTVSTEIHLYIQESMSINLQNSLRRTYWAARAIPTSKAHIETGDISDFDLGRWTM